MVVGYSVVLRTNFLTYCITVKVYTLCTLDVQHRYIPLRKHAHMIYSNFFRSKIDNFQRKIFDIFLIFAQNIDCGHTLELPRRGGSNEYPQSMFWSKNKKNRYTPAYPSFTI